jgi:hypothetical protein
MKLVMKYKLIFLVVLAINVRNLNLKLRQNYNNYSFNVLFGDSSFSLNFPNKAQFPYSSFGNTCLINLDNSLTCTFNYLNEKQEDNLSKNKDHHVDNQKKVENYPNVQNDQMALNLNDNQKNVEDSKKHNPVPIKHEMSSWYKLLYGNIFQSAKYKEDAHIHLLFTFETFRIIRKNDFPSVSEGGPYLFEGNKFTIFLTFIDNDYDKTDNAFKNLTELFDIFKNLRLPLYSGLKIHQHVETLNLKITNSILVISKYPSHDSIDCSSFEESGKHSLCLDTYHVKRFPSYTKIYDTVVQIEVEINNKIIRILILEDQALSNRTLVKSYKPKHQPVDKTIKVFKAEDIHKDSLKDIDQINFVLNTIFFIMKKVKESWPFYCFKYNQDNQSGYVCKFDSLHRYLPYFDLKKSEIESTLYYWLEVSNLNNPMKIRLNGPDIDDKLAQNVFENNLFKIGLEVKSGLGRYFRLWIGGIEFSSPDFRFHLELGGEKIYIYQTKYMKFKSFDFYKKHLPVFDMSWDYARTFNISWVQDDIYTFTLLNGTGLYRPIIEDISITPEKMKILEVFQRIYPYIVLTQNDLSNI